MKVLIIVLLVKILYCGENIIVKRGVVMEVILLKIFRNLGVVRLNNVVFIVFLDEIVVFGINEVY